MSELLHSGALIFWSAITLMVIVPTIAHYVWKWRQSELDAGLKHEMLQQGMSAEEIERVLAAGSDGSERVETGQEL